MAFTASNGRTQSALADINITPLVDVVLVLVIIIDKQQRVFLGNDPININEIGATLRKKVRDPAHQSIFLRADEDVPFGAFATVMDAVKSSGISNVSIVTQPLETHGQR